MLYGSPGMIHGPRLPGSLGGGGGGGGAIRTLSPTLWATALFSAVLVLSACSTMSRTVTVGDPAAEARADVAETALNDLRKSLAAAQNALGADNSTEEAARAVATARDALTKLRNRLTMEQRESVAGTAVNNALESVDTALKAVSDALGATTAALGSGRGTISFASMHTSLDRAQAALDTAQAALGGALEANPDAPLRTLLAQAQATLTTAQLSLMPLLRQELETARAAREAAEAERDEARAAQEATEDERDEARAAQEATEAERNEARAAREAAEAERNEARAAREAAEAERDEARAAQEATEDERDEARAAQEATEDERDEARAAQEAAEAERDEARAAQEATEDERDEARAAQEATEDERDEARAERDALRDEHVHPPLFRSTRGPRTLGATITVTRTARTVPNSAGDAWVANPDALDIATDAVPYVAGTTLASRAGDEFPMRAITFRGDIRQGSQRGMTGAAADNDGRYPIIQGPGNTLGNANDHTKTAVISSIRLSEDGGLVLEAGGSGVVFNEFQYDIRGTEADGPDGIPGDGGATTATTATDFHAAMFRRAGETPPSVGDTLTQAQADKLTGWAADNCSGVTFPCWDGNMRDLTIDFGLPSPDPDGESGYHWTSKIPSSEGQPKPEAAEAMHRWAKPKVDNFVDPERGAGEYRGEYRVWLSNYAGLDSGATDAETDDSHRYLQYAAYGLFTLTDYLTSNVRPARMQGFHFGYDAFADAAGMRTTDLDDPITATFKGRASGMVMEPHSDRSQVERLIRVRGDVTLDATIGGANTITGSISNFETPSGRAWGPYAPLTDSVRLTNGTIAADGSYGGDTTVDGAASHLWDAGAFGGNFYGNRGGPDLETAGWWYLTARGYTPPQTNPLTGGDARDYPGRPDFRYSGAFGSFGAACTEGCD